MKALAWAVAVLNLAVAFTVTAEPADPGEPSLRAAVPAVVEALMQPSDNAGLTVAATLRAVALAEGLDVGVAPQCPSLADALSLHAQRLGTRPPSLPSQVDSRLERALACLLSAIHEANLAMDATFEGVSHENLMALYRSEDDAEPFLVSLLSGRNHRANLAAAIHVADAVARALPLLKDVQASAALPPIDVEPLLFLDASGDTVHTDNYVLTVDLAGNDTYDNHAGGLFLAAGNAFFDVEPGSAWNQTSILGQNVAVGGGTQDADFAFSSSLVLDLAGDDVWGVKHAPMLADAENGCGTSLRVPYVGTNGAGILGVGMAFDLAGDNEYYGRTQSQGAGHVFGVGVLYTGPGRDEHEAVRGGMGSGLLGGVGLLIDEGGPSTYTLAAPSGGVFNGDRRFCDADPRYGIGGNFDRKDGPFTPQIGILADLGGNDSYAALHSAIAFSQGSGFGLLLDAAGDDAYDARNITQGAGHGRAVPFEPEAFWSGGAAFLLDITGNDSYTAVSEAQGWALGDTLASPVPPTDDLDAFLQWTIKREDAVGFLFDGAGDDTYNGPAGRVDGAHVTDGTLGVFVDAG